MHVFTNHTNFRQSGEKKINATKYSIFSNFLSKMDYLDNYEGDALIENTGT